MLNKIKKMSSYMRYRVSCKVMLDNEYNSSYFRCDNRSKMMIDFV